MKPFVRKFRVMNPHKRRKTSRSRKSRKSRRNPGELILLTNPYRGGGVSKMKKHSRKRRSSRRRKSNPIVKSHSRRSSRRYFARRRSNPSLGGFSVGSLAKMGIGTAVGALGTRAVTQAILRDKNVDLTGYAASAAVAIGLGWLGAKFVSKEVGAAVASGGIAGLAVRVYTEKISKTSSNLLSGLGDMEFSSDGLGGYIDTGYPVPTVSQAGAGGYVVSGQGAGQSGLSAGASASPVVAVDRFRSRFAVQ